MWKLGTLLVGLAWLAFMVCLFLPAVEFYDGREVLGWKVGLAAISEFPPLNITLDDILLFVGGVGNVVLAFSPIALLFVRRNVYLVLAVVNVVLFGVAASFYASNSGFASGYFLWVAAFLMMALGLGVLTTETPYNLRPCATRQSRAAGLNR